MDHVRRRYSDGRPHARGCDVPSLAACDEVGRVVSLYGHDGAHWVVLRHCDCATDILCHHGDRCVARYLDFPSAIRRCWLCESLFHHPLAPVLS